MTYSLNSLDQRWDAIAAKNYVDAQSHSKFATELAINDSCADLNRLWTKFAVYLSQLKSESRLNFDAALSNFQTNWQSEHDVSFFADQQKTEYVHLPEGIAW